MTVRAPLPDGLPPDGFTVSAGRARGVPRHRLHAQDLTRPHWGVRVPASVALSLMATCRALAVALPSHAFFCGVSAAELLGMPVPIRYSHSRDAPLEVGVADPARAIRRRGVHGRRLRVEPTDVTATRGIRLTTPARTWCDLAPLLSLGELVAAGDYLIFHERPVVTRAELAAAVDRHPGRRWRTKLRQALALLDERSESPKESLVRVLVISRGFPAPRANVRIYNEFGQFVARVDLFFEDYREILEYQGDQHRTDQRQWRRDLARRAELESLGFHLTELTADDLTNVAPFIRRLERNLRRRGWTGHASNES